jgi:DNA-binding transcriptional LysR family regulator
VRGNPRTYERGPGGVTPTTIWDAFTRHALAVLAQLSQADQHVTELDGCYRGTVVVGTNPGSHVLLPQAIAGLKSERPLLTVIVRESSPEALSTELMAGDLDLIVGRFTSPPTESEVCIPLYDEFIEICTRAQHPLVQRRTITFADLGDYPWIIPGQETALRRAIEYLAHARRHPNQIELYEPGLRALPVPFEPMTHSVGITAVGGRALSPSANALIQHLQAIAAKRLNDKSDDDIRGRRA